MSVQFEYEITAGTFEAAQSLYLAATKSRRLMNSMICILIGAVSMLASHNEPPGSAKFWGFAFLAVIWLCAGLAVVLSGSLLRTRYERSGVKGNRYKASVDASGFQVAGAGKAWVHIWRQVSVRGEDEQVIMFYATPTIFAFGKHFLTAEQQQEIRHLANMPPYGWTSSSTHA